MALPWIVPHNRDDLISLKLIFLFMEGGIVLYYLLIRARSRDRILTFKQLRSVVFKKSHTVDFDLLVVLHNCVSTYLYFKFKISNLSN